MAEPPKSFEVELRDGTRALIRPIEPGDKERLAEGLRRLSPQSRYLRFHAPVDHLTAEQLRYLTEIDYADHMAWVALNLDALEEPGMGVARYVRVQGEPEVAEAAVTVADEYQGRGLGSLLIAVLSRSAIEHGIRTLRNYVLVENEAMLDIFDELGAVRHDEGHGVYRVDMPLPDDPDELPQTPALRVLRATAKRNLPPFRVLAERLGHGLQELSGLRSRSRSGDAGRRATDAGAGEGIHEGDEEDFAEAIDRQLRDHR